MNCISNFSIQAIPSGPLITPNYHIGPITVGDQVSLNCSCLGSLPAPDITWYINTRPVTNTNLYTVHHRDTGTSDYVLQLAFTVRASHFQVVLGAQICLRNTGCPPKLFPLLFVEFLGFLGDQKFHIGHFSIAHFE